MLRNPYLGAASRSSIVFGSEITAFFEGGSALIVGTVGANGAPHASRGWGLDVLSDEHSTTTVRLLVDADDVATIENLQAGRPVAITGADVPTLHATQVKGRPVRVEAPDPGDKARAARYCHLFFTDIAKTDGTMWGLMERLVPTDYVPCIIELDAIFNQTPGPTAGMTVESQGS
jgi:hypothetical protein